MQSLHIRANKEILEKIVAIVNDFSSKGEDIEILDNLTYDLEKKIITKGLIQEKNNQTITHENLWNELLNLWKLSTL